ncbi:MAG TPA: PEP-CTERM sorting domain-containing protein [Roseiarcus sp.]|nr:PEP-CTERM sorting domain-containing protein [Roseiarcus sp.]
MGKTLLASGLVCALLSAAPAQATVIAPGTLSATPDILTLGAGASLVANTGLHGFISTPSGALTGAYGEEVWSDPANTFGAGDLTWVIQIVNLSSTDHVLRITASSFNGFLTDVGYKPQAEVAPGTVDRVTANVIGFNLDVAPSGFSDPLLIETNATKFKPGTLLFIDSETATAAAFGPATAVLEPSTWAMMGLGFAGLGMLLLNRGRRKEADCAI